MNERDAYQLARGFAEVRESRWRGYEYVCVSVEAVRALTAEAKYQAATTGPTLRPHARGRNAHQPARRS